MTKRGRKSLFETIDMEQVKKLVEYGHDDKFCASFFGVTERTWCNWKNEHPDFFRSLKGWKAAADEVVERALFERARGYSAQEEKVLADGQVVPIIKHYPPDPTCCIYWLKNRQPGKWRDKREIDHTTNGDNIVSPKILSYDDETKELIKRTLDRKK